jgi:hypothetical protein
MSKETNGNNNTDSNILQPDSVDGQRLENPNEEKKEWLPIRGIKFVGRQIAKIPGAVREHPKAAAVVFTAIGVGLKTGFDALISAMSDDDSSDDSQELLPEPKEDETPLLEEEPEEPEEVEEEPEEVE